MQSIAILLTVHNRKDKTLECLKRLYNQDSLNNYLIEIYLTNDACTDGTTESIMQLYPKVHIINGNGNLFWNRGMHTAWEEAAKNHYDFYLWLNDDTFVYSNMLTSLLQAAKEKGNEAIIVGATQSIDHQTTTYGGRLENGEIQKPNGELVSIHHFNGNIVLIPHYVYDKIGNLDYHFTHSKGDFDYGLRAGKVGIKMFQVGKYLGECEQHKELDTWCNPKVPLKRRWEMLHRPNGMPPKETFYFEKRHINLWIAIIHYFTIYIRCIIPQLWIIRSGKKQKH
ncbi:glycosyltransferase family 2 protein [Phocaeicola coprophilus]|uniref:Glycosyltransferase family 2 protein n=1 Tax=Phocaeicola coprophilus TaxID=387090 RepID=A0A413SZJ3_9BACT|nr:glycosyltransferase family 2 protein [Phocaeicola coprophilus]RHA75404.1 glycosyltransferase family 2 protein [Phocaeicola coprophilus]